MTWRNWAGNQTACPARVERPEREDDLVRLDRYDRLRHIDPDSGLVRVEAGMSLRRLNALLAQLGRG